MFTTNCSVYRHIFLRLFLSTQRIHEENLDRHRLFHHFRLKCSKRELEVDIFSKTSRQYIETDNHRKDFQECIGPLTDIETDEYIGRETCKSA